LIPEGSVPEIKPKTKEILQKESDVRDKYKCEDIFKNNLDVHIEDLKRKMSIVHDPKKVMLDFLQEEANVLKKDLSMPELTPILARSSENEEREQEVTKTIAPGGNKFFGDDKRREKVQALVWLKILIQKGSVPVPHLVNGKRPEAGARNLAQRKVLSTMKDLKNYLKDAGMEENVFSSFLKNKGGMQKVFALADYYMDPENKLYKLAANTSATLPRRLAQSV
jgi:hypothetical protein